MFIKQTSKTKPDSIEMVLDHDGNNWTVFDGRVTISAASLNELDRKLEQALSSRLSQGEKLKVLMTSNNEMIPEWMRPYMNHYFNRILELPLRY